MSQGLRLPKIFCLCSLIGIASVLVYSQAPHPLTFWPYMARNAWQYRDTFNDSIFYTRYNDRESLAVDGTIYIWGRIVSGSENPLQERIDTSFNLYNLRFQSGYPRYKLGAVVGQSWQAGVLGSDTVRVTVASSFSDRVFGVLTTIKLYRFEIVRPAPLPVFWLGDDYLASGFGLVSSRQEPNLQLYLSGAIIDSVRWGTILSADEEGESPITIGLRQNFPNPFNPTTTIEYGIDRMGRVTLRVFDILGREMLVLVDEQKPRGSYSVSFSANAIQGGFASGVYLYRLEANGRTQTKKMVIQK